MKILMLGWEFPPYFSGGVGTVCHSLTKALIRRGNQITYLMPKGPEDIKAKNSFLKMRIANNEHPISLRQIDSLLSMPYDSMQDYRERYERHIHSGQGDLGDSLYGKTLLEEVDRFAQQAAIIAMEEDFDVIHAHDWVTFKAGIAIKKATGKPLVVHIHITEFDKSGGEHANPAIYSLERQGMLEADLVVAISNFVKERCIHNYYIPPEKIRVVHNGVDIAEHDMSRQLIKPHEKVILFLGRVTLQKGPEYFIKAARRVVDIDPNVKFVMAGTGDMLPRMIELSAELGLSSHMIFSGFVSREQGDELFRIADVFVMPSVSEPFGLVPLEAMAQGTPTIISKQSGVSEVVQNALKVDFWDIDGLASKMLAALHYSVLGHTLSDHGTVEVRGLNWETPAQGCENVYKELMGMYERGEMIW